jgi:hypothetical protein
VAQALVQMNVVNSEPIAVGHSEIDGSQGQAFDDGFQFREKLKYIFFIAMLLIIHSISDRPVVACYVVFHRADLPAFLPQYSATGIPRYNWQPDAGCFRHSKIWIIGHLVA